MFAASAGQTFVKIRDGKAQIDDAAQERLPPRRYLGEDGTLDEFIEVVKSHAWAKASFNARRSAALWKAIRRDIPIEISDDATVTDFSLTIGPNDWAEAEPVAGDPPPCIYYGRSEVALSLFGYRSPFNPPVYREMLFKIPEFIQLQRDIEGVLGPVKRCISWSF